MDLRDDWPEVEVRKHCQRVRLSQNQESLKGYENGDRVSQPPKRQGLLINLHPK